jgi:hypothetical protein
LSIEENKIPIDPDSDVDLDRRRALMSVGRLAAYVAPAMTVLIPGDEAEAQQRPPWRWGWWWRCRRRPRPSWCDSRF